MRIIFRHTTDFGASMLGLTAPQLCELCEMGFTRFETRRRRGREEQEKDRVDTTAALTLPINDFEGGKWVRHDFEEALAVRVTVVLEQAGISYEEAVRIVVGVGLNDFFMNDSSDDFWIGRIQQIDGRRHVWGTIADVSKRRPDDRAVIIINVSDVARHLTERATTLGYVISGRTIEKSRL